MYTEAVQTAQRRQLAACGMAETALGSAVRLGDAEVIEEVCAAAWNLALPLLGEPVRTHAHDERAREKARDTNFRGCSLRARRWAISFACAAQRWTEWRR
jgi:hypothetical protein